MGDETHADYVKERRARLGLSPASHARDPHTAKIAGSGFEQRGISDLHELVLEALRAGPLTDEELERLPQFARLAPSTVRKRRSELFHMGRIKRSAVVQNARGRPMLKWALPSRPAQTAVDGVRPASS